MFYAHIVLAKKGPFARIWLAAHWDKKLTKAHVFETNIEQSVEGIMQPKVKLALRTSGHLLLGVVRIYSRKAKYLLADCNEAFVKIKMAFRPGMVDLPEEHREAAVNAITLPEVFHDFDTALPELNDVDIEAQFSINQSRADEITMREDYGSIPMSIHDEGFGDMALDDIDFAHNDPNTIDDNLMEDLDAAPGGMSGGSLGEPRPGTSRSLLGSLDVPDLGGDGFGDAIGADGFGEPANGLFEGDLFADATLGGVHAPPAADVAAGEAAAGAGADSDDDMDDMGGGGWQNDGNVSPAPSSPIEFMATSPPAKGLHASAGEADHLLAGAEALTSGQAEENDENNANVLNQLADGDEEMLLPPPEEVADLAANDGGALLHNNNEEESFALAPVDASALRGVTKAKRKRKLIVDEVKNISGEEMKSQLANTSDIITTLDLAPPTKRLMYWKDTGGVEKVFTLCSRDIKARVLFRSNQRHFQLRAHHLDDFTQLGPSDVLALDQYQQDAEAAAAGGRRGRKRKLATVPESPPPTTTAAAAAAATEPALPTVDQLQQTVDDSVERFDGSNRQSILLPDDPSVMHLSDKSLSASHIVGVADETTGSAQLRNADAVSMMGSPLPPPPLVDDLLPVPLPLGDRTPLPGGDAFMDDGGPPDMTPGYSVDYGGAADIHSPAYAPSYGGDVTPHHPMVEMDAIPNLPADQVQSILNDGFGDAPAATAAGAASVRLANDWSDTGADGFDFPPEVATHQPGDEQLENETDEQFEERVLNKRAAQMFVSVRARMQSVDHMYLSEMTQRNNRKQAAQKFYSLLVLKKFRALDIRQDTSYGDILVTKGTMFDNPKL